MTRLLVKKYGADVDARDNVRKLLGFCCCCSLRTSTRVRFLSIILVQDGLTPLHEAAWNGFENVAACLIEKCDANINARDKVGRQELAMILWYKCTVTNILLVVSMSPLENRKGTHHFILPVISNMAKWCKRCWNTELINT